MEFVKRNFPEYKNSEYSEIIKEQKIPAGKTHWKILALGIILQHPPQGHSLTRP